MYITKEMTKKSREQLFSINRINNNLIYNIYSENLIEKKGKQI